MPAFIVVQVNVKDPGKYVEYGTAWNVQSFMEDYGGEFIMMSNGPEAEVLEGNWSSRLVVMKFPGAEKARALEPRPEGDESPHSPHSDVVKPGFHQAAPAELTGCASRTQGFSVVVADGCPVRRAPGDKRTLNPMSHARPPGPTLGRGRYAHAVSSTGGPGR